ncbi:MAG: IPT/TIG domain-containing protein [Anaerolineae bacterium]|nr:IPT/TIG domain-containing protein [Anaerolineae bacterium]
MRIRRVVLGFFRLSIVCMCVIFMVSTVSAANRQSWSSVAPIMPADVNGDNMVAYLGANQSVPLEMLTITGPTSALPDTSSEFTANVTPISATLPITYVWESTWPFHTPVTHVSYQLTDTVVFTWTTMATIVFPEEQQIIAHATNAAGVNVTDTRTIWVGYQQTYRLSLQNLQKDSGGISSRYVITNVGTVIATVAHDFYTDSGTVVASLYDTIVPGYGQVYDLATMMDLPDAYSGYVIVSSDEPISGTVLADSPLAPYAPTLPAIQNPDGDGNYSVQWTYDYATPPVTAYTLQEATSTNFITEVTEYSLNDTSRDFTDKSIGTYYYRVRGTNAYGDGLWSSVQSVIVEHVSPAPIVSSIEPNYGPDNQITWVTINGANFVATPRVMLGSADLSGISLVNSAQLLAAVPAGMANGVYDVRVCNPDDQCGTLPEGYTVTGSAPILTGIVPNQGFNDAPNDVILYGYSLQEGIVVAVGTVLLEDVTWVDSTKVRAVIPAGLAIGNYDVVARNPGSPDTATLAAGYLVLDPAGDDFSTTSDDIWTTPITIRQGDSVMLGANVRRQGGKASLQPQVAFYQGDPEQGGVWLGTALTPPMPSGAGIVDSAFIQWDTTGIEGTAKIYAVVDSDQAITETSEVNNTAWRYITVLSDATDLVPPVITGLLANDGAASTSTPGITITVVADDGGGSGVSSLYLVEREFNSAARQWVAVQNIGWVPFQSSYAMTLTDRGGARYIQAWVADRAGNISEVVYKTRIDYIPDTQTIRAGQVHLYRRDLALGQMLSVTLKTLSGDADLYIWRPDGAQSWVSNDEGTDTDAVSFAAPQAGVYQIEVYGYMTSEYRLYVSAGDLMNAQPAGLFGQNLKLDKPVRSQPIIQPDNEPEGSTAIPVAPIQPISLYRVLLPVVLRGG